MPTINPHIFRAYDIRGKAESDLTPAIYLLIGKAFGSIVREQYGVEHPTVAVGRDMRTHSPTFQTALIEGLVSTGCKVFDIGETPSPVNYFIICNRNFDAGLQVTASHNPKEDNGLKLQIRKAQAFAGEDIQTLRKRIDTGNFLMGKGSVEMLDALTPYMDAIGKEFKQCGKGFTVVIDSGNGANGPAAVAAFERIGCRVIGLYTEPDGTFPNHIADPSKRTTLKELQETILREQAHLGFGFDGDGDRIGVVDEHGAIRSCDEILLLLAQHYLKLYPGSPIVFTVSMSSALETEIRKWGGTPVMCVVGHSFVEHEMHTHKAPLGGEQSGHFFLEDLAHGYDDALIVALQILRIASLAKKPFSALFEEFPKVYLAQELRPACPDSEKTRIVKAVTEHFRKDYPVVDIDGARIDFGEGAWANIRQANTSPKLSICMEARSEKKLKEMQKLVLDHMKTYPEIVWEE
ncbi:MAG: phosphomannomutase/phosphoglucomutase [Candidatus Peribacteraceae bacterium]|nr:phosphomannomutase/phosphoglucomutase [Candidatus Peribacteraceae bacterium]